MYRPDHESILASMLGAVLVLSDQDRIVYVNPAAEALLQMPAAAIDGHALTEIFADAPWVTEVAARVREEPVASVRDAGKLNDGTDDDIVAVASILTDAGGVDGGIVLTLHNLGPRHRMQSDEIARSRLTDLDKLVATVGHEINNPLSGIRGAAQYLGNKLEQTPDLVQYAEMIVRQADRMADLVRVLMELEAPAPQRTALNIHRVLNEVLLLAGREIREHGLRFMTRFDPSLPEIVGDADRLEQVFLNLVKNAMAACPEDGSGVITVRTRIENGFHLATDGRRVHYIAVEVEDNGPGFDAEIAGQIFNPFFSRTPGGHGMGLAIARNIVTAHHGQLRAESPDGCGARFSVSLPVTSADEHSST